MAICGFLVALKLFSVPSDGVLTGASLSAEGVSSERLIKLLVDARNLYSLASLLVLDRVVEHALTDQV